MPVYEVWRRDPFWFHLTFEFVHGISSLVLAFVLIFDVGAWWRHRKSRKAS